MVLLAVVGVSVLAPLVALVGTVVLFGWQLSVIETGSMAPTYPAGSLAIVEPIDAAQVQPGMTVVFRDPDNSGRLVAHRVTRLIAGAPLRFETQGDANLTVDQNPVLARDINGRVRWAVPRLGSVAEALHGPSTPLVLVGVPLVLLVVSEGIVLTRRRSRAQTETDEPLDEDDAERRPAPADLMFF